MDLTLCATSTFGLEAVVARELENLGYSDVEVTDGRVRFRGTLRDLARCCLWLRTADRLLIEVGQFPAKDFGVLFDSIKQLPWPELLPVDAAFPVQARCIRSQLRSVPKVQGVSKKAIVESLKQKHQRFRFEETGPPFPIEVSLLNDVACVTIDATGDGLHKRGYREVVGRAPLRETMAAGLIQLSYWNSERVFADPFCGSGTLPIEAALAARNVAPGLSRTFLSEDWPWFERSLWKEARVEARDLKLRRAPAPILASDHDPEAIRLAKRGAGNAGVLGDIDFEVREVSDFRSAAEFGVIICNPPYGERLGTNEEVEAVYRIMGRTFEQLPTWSVYALTSYRWFEKHFGRRATRRRKLFAGKLECQYYQYPGPRPPAPHSADQQTSADGETANLEPKPNAPADHSG